MTWPPTGVEPSDDRTGQLCVTIAGGTYLWFCHPDAVPDLATIKDNATGFSIEGE